MGRIAGRIACNNAGPRDLSALARTLGLLSALLDINNPDAPDDHDLSLVSNTLRDAIADARTDASLKCRLGAENRRSSQLVRDRMRASW